MNGDHSNEVNGERCTSRRSRSQGICPTHGLTLGELWFIQAGQMSHFTFRIPNAIS